MNRKTFVLLSVIIVASMLLAACAPKATATPTAVVEQKPTDAATTEAPTAAPDTSGVEEAKTLIQALEAPVEFKAPGPALNIGESMKGKKVYFIANGLNYPFVQSLLGGLDAAAKLVGMEIIPVDGAGEASKASTLVEQGIAQKADLIIIQSFPAEQLTASLKEAKAANIPVIEMFGRDPQLPSKELLDVGVEGIVGYCYSCAGKQMAQFAVAESGGNVNAVVFNVPEIGTAALERDGFINELTRLCPTCKVKSVDAPLAQWNDSLPKLTSTQLQSDPTINYLIPLYDSMVSLMKPQVIALGMESTVKIVTYNGTLPGLQDVLNKDIVSGDIGGMNAWIGWAAMDQILRILSGSGAVADENVPHRAFTASNISSIDLTKDESTWYGTLDLAKEYSNLWGVK